MNALSSSLRRLFGAGHDCLLCSSASADWVCESCACALPSTGGDVCPGCAAASLAGHLCGACLSHPLQFDAAVAAFRYRFPVDQLLHRYKYAAQIPLAGFFCGRFRELLSGRETPDLVVAVPLSRERLAERGFNQAGLLAEGVAKYWKVRVDRGMLRRIRHTLPQAELELTSRQANVKDAFVCDRDVTGKHIALFDDVMTTGSTLNEAAKALKRRGASRVTAWVVARAEKHEAGLAGGGRDV